MSQSTLIATRTAPNSIPVPHTGYASWGRRAAAALIDDGVFILISWIVTVLWVITTIEWIADLADQPSHSSNTPLWPPTMFWGWLAILLLMLPIQLAVSYWNFGKLQGRTGASWGKRIVGIMVVDEATGAVLGIGKSFGRDLLHVIDATGFYLGYLWPLWDERNRTFTDIVLNTIVVNQPPKGSNIHE
ncbi:hypothetical protein GOEFS_115_00950 [Gordonia effusa NBRC 100432]|uniref:RDD domain-containing protein n=1 Tax=Gordonia effusa NBRC 100432 TaxID=1077974 RepID=H0R5V4_9ACTN|nr:RDD family protein [Gordonia effusa]GAB20455.1 hypothetical protein GOEFS_115_00950 [Gordonia effusa NBRC 100432]